MIAEPRDGVWHCLCAGQRHQSEFSSNTVDHGRTVGTARERIGPKHILVIPCPRPWKSTKAVREPRPPGPEPVGLASEARSTGPFPALPALPRVPGRPDVASRSLNDEAESGVVYCTQPNPGPLFLPP